MTGQIISKNKVSWQYLGISVYWKERRSLPSHINTAWSQTIVFDFIFKKIVFASTSSPLLLWQGKIYHFPFKEFLERGTVWLMNVAQSPMWTSPSPSTSGQQAWNRQQVDTNFLPSSARLVIMLFDPHNLADVAPCTTSSTWLYLAYWSPPWLCLDSRFHRIRGKNLRLVGWSLCVWSMTYL